ncbi:MAG: hypothetical protein A2289_05020 [Deltaproteobacteria bacterium RIFOXYA12_FULL_58_15]|nr:MAG: hypothetical protein A2289_05020 [Deltaproteobacteria bacterium RIFOXYA12_FULL_58_15]
MERLNRQRGYTRPTKLFLLVLAAGLAYLGATFWGPASTYYSMRMAGKRLANRVLTQGGDPELYVRQFLNEAYHRDGLTLTRPDVSVDHTRNEVKVSARLMIPYRFPFVDEIRFWGTTVDVSAARMGRL